MNRAWAFTWHSLLFAAVAFGSPFLVLYYQSLGFGGAQIGLLVGLNPLLTLFASPLWTALADATGRHRLIMSVALLAGTAAIAALPLVRAFVPVALLVVLFTIFLAPVVPLGTSATMVMLGDEKRAYGRIRLGGTIGYGLAAVATGALVQAYGLAAAFWGCAAFCLLTLLASQKLIYDQAAGGYAVRSGVRTLLGDVRWLLFLAVALASGVASVPTGSYFLPYMAELGAPRTMMGIAISISVLSEVPVFLYGHRLVGRLSAYGVLVLSLAITGLRLVAYAACRAPGLALLLQLSAGLSYPAMWLAGVFYAQEHAPAGVSAAAQGLFGAVLSGLGAALGGFYAGLLLESAGARGMFLAFGLAALAAAAVATPIGQRLHGSRRAPSASPRARAE